MLTVARLLQHWPRLAATMRILVGSKIQCWIEISLGIFECGAAGIVGCSAVGRWWFKLFDPPEKLEEPDISGSSIPILDII